MAALKVGLVGLPDSSSREWCAEWSALPDIEIAAASDADPLRRERATQHLSIGRIYSSWQEMLGKE
ncbi:MAG: hypothetical protein M3Y56_16910, partial [Armatimonadota bacterium]|nr:hypothetical protein [Armatimonadota bacterium]